MNIMYETHKMEDPRAPFIMHKTHIRAGRTAYACNWHENVELICVEKGAGFIVIDDEHISISEGDVAIIDANRLHGLYTGDSKMSYLCLIIDRSFFTSNHFDSNNFIFTSKVHDGELVSLMQQFSRYHLSTSAEEPMRIQHMRSIALKISLLICERYATFDRTPRTESHMLSCIKLAIGYIRAESHRNMSLDEVSSFVGLSKYYFAREFRRVTGYSFVSYLNTVRCEKAKEMLLNDDLGVGEVGMRCGFENFSYFTRTFKEYAGITPSEYRKNNRI